MARKGSRGQAFVLMALLIPIVVGMAGLAVDGGNVYVNRTNVQRTADAAALAGARSVLTSSSQGTTDAKSYASQNSDPNAVVTVLSVTRPHDAVRVTSQKSVSMTMMRILGITSATVSGTATAQIAPPGGAMGLLPWAINDDSFANYGYDKTVGLQPANGNGGNGQFNWVSITPPCAPAPAICQNYAEAIVSGVTSMLLVNTNYPTNTFDGSGLSVTTANALKARINGSPGETYNTFATASPRVVFVPVIGGNIPNAPTPVRFTGFRAFFLESVNQAQGTVFGRFVKATLPIGLLGGATVPDKGLLVIKLTS